MNELKSQIEREKQVEIKKATLEDLKDIQELSRKLCQKESKDFDPTINENYSIQEAGEKYLRERIESGFASVAKVDSKIVGYLLGEIAEGADYRNVSKIGEAESMLVADEYRSSGLGSKLMQEFIAWCKENKAEKMRVVASAKNIKGIEFYKREGFEDYDVVLERNI